MDRRDKDHSGLHIKQPKCSWALLPSPFSTAPRPSHWSGVEQVCLSTVPLNLGLPSPLDYTEGVASNRVLHNCSKVVFWKWEKAHCSVI
jgi:hypothetical protein